MKPFISLIMEFPAGEEDSTVNGPSQLSSPGPWPPPPRRIPPDVVTANGTENGFATGAGGAAVTAHGRSAVAGLRPFRSRCWTAVDRCFRRCLEALRHPPSPSCDNGPFRVYGTDSRGQRSAARTATADRFAGASAPERNGGGNGNSSSDSPPYLPADRTSLGGRSGRYTRYSLDYTSGDGSGAGGPSHGQRRASGFRDLPV